MPCGARSARPSRERKRPSVCGFRPLPLASPGKGRSFRRPSPCPRSATKGAGACDSSVEPPPETSAPRTCVPDDATLEFQQPVRPSDRIARFETLSALGAIDAAFGSGFVSAVPLASRHGLGWCFTSASRRCREPEGSLVRREKQAVRLGFAATLPRPGKLTIGAPERAVTEPVHEWWKTAVIKSGSGANPSGSRLSTGSESCSRYRLGLLERVLFALPPVRYLSASRASRFSSSASHSSSASASVALALSNSAVRRSNETRSLA